MNLGIKQDLVPESKYSIKCPYAMTAEGITIHNTANDASAANEIKYMKSNDKEISYHIAVDDKEAILGIPLNRNAWAAGDGAKGKGNRTQIHIEICYSKSGGPKYQKAEERTIKLVAQMLHLMGWGIDRVKKHQDWSGKNCPHRILNDNRWDAFKRNIEQELKSLKKPKVVEQVKQVAFQSKAPVGPSRRVNVVTGALGDDWLLQMLAFVQEQGWSAKIEVPKEGNPYFVVGYFNTGSGGLHKLEKWLQDKKWSYKIEDHK